MPNTTLLFFIEIVTFLVLTTLLYWFVYRRLRDRIRTHQRSVEQQPGPPSTDDRVDRLKYALSRGGWHEPSRFVLWVLILVWAFSAFMSVLLLLSDRVDGLEGLGQFATAAGLMGFAAGHLVYTERRGFTKTLAGVLWVASAFLATLGVAFLVAFFYAEGTAGTTVVAVLFAVGILLFYIDILTRYIKAGSGEARQQG